MITLDKLNSQLSNSEIINSQIFNDKYYDFFIKNNHIYFVTSDNVRSFANIKQKGEIDSGYKTVYSRAGTDSPHCKGNGTSGTNGDTLFFSKTGKLLLWRYSRRIANIKSNGFATPQRAERGRTYSG